MSYQFSAEQLVGEYYFSLIDALRRRVGVWSGIFESLVIDLILLTRVQPDSHVIRLTAGPHRRCVARGPLGNLPVLPDPGFVYLKLVEASIFSQQGMAQRLDYRRPSRSLSFAKTGWLRKRDRPCRLNYALHLVQTQGMAPVPSTGLGSREAGIDHIRAPE